MKAFILNHKRSLLISLIAIILIAVSGVVLILSQSKFSADEPLWTDITKGALKVGRYYVDGDTSQYYLEITEEGTIQLKGVDYFEYASYRNEMATTAMIEELAEEYSQAYKYLVVSYRGFEYPYVFTHYDLEPSGLLSGYGYIYIDENTIFRNLEENAEIFIYRDENSPQTFSAPDKITRIVDAVHTEE